MQAIIFKILLRTGKGLRFWQPLRPIAGIVIFVTDMIDSGDGARVVFPLLIGRPAKPVPTCVIISRAVSTDTLEIEIQPPILLTGNATSGSTNSTTETFTVSATQATTGEIVLAESPSEAMVFLNGLLITDYSISGSILAISCLEENDFLVVKY